jgi:tetratricopeptide (TPR) repeat protein
LTLKPDFVNAHFNLGNALQEQGELDEAIAHYERAIAFKPGYAEAHNNLGNGLKQQGKLGEATAHYQLAIALKPDYAEAHNNLGIALKEQGELDEAMVHYQRAVALKPGSVDAHTNLGNGFKQQGKYGEAMAHYQRAIALRRDYAEAHNNFGIALKEQDKLDEAMVHCQRAVALKPGSAEAHNNLGNVFKQHGKYAEAMVHYQRSLALKPDYAEVYHNMGNVLKEHGKYDEALAHYQRAVALKPDFAEAYYNLGVALRELGQFDEAQRAYESALELAPRNGLYYRQVFYGKRVVTEDRSLAAAKKLAEDMASLPMEDQRELHFALGKAYEDLEQRERSFRHRLEGNALKRREFVYDEPKMLGFLDRIRAVFTTELMHSKRDLGDASKVPIFIVGMPRSGTTLVEQILASPLRFLAPGSLRNSARRWRASVCRMALCPSPRPFQLCRPDSCVNSAHAISMPSELRRRGRSASPTRCRRISTTSGSFIWRYPMRVLSICAETRLTRVFPAFRCCSPVIIPTAMISGSWAAIIGPMRR